MADRRLAAGCELRSLKRVNIYYQCGAYFPNVSSGKPPDEPAPAQPRPKFRVARD